MRVHEKQSKESSWRNRSLTPSERKEIEKLGKPYLIKYATRSGG
jgi:hypothetical protein